jgi:hypothetical protein
MNGGAKILALAAGFAAAGCQSGPGTVEVRALPNPADKIRAGSDGLADARAQLALGNIGLALEAFRKALRETPDNPEAYAGIAKCYETMGRYDLARHNYEIALAFAPKDPRLLGGFAVAAAAAATPPPREAPAAALEATQVDEPMFARRDLPASGVDMRDGGDSLREVRQLRSLAVAGPSITVELPPARPAPSVIAPGNSPSDPGKQAAVQQSTEVAIARDLPASRVDLQASAVSTPARQEFKVLASAGPSITVQLPPARPVAVAEIAVARPPVPAVSPRPGPQLVRMSPGEVALVTSNRPIWRAQLMAETRTSTTVRWVPLARMASSRPNIRLLNAARVQNLAANSRGMLLDRGWRKIEIGNALDVREESMVIYPAARRTLARSLAAQFGLSKLVAGKGDVFVVLLGRDAARRAGPPKRG